MTKANNSTTKEAKGLLSLGYEMILLFVGLIVSGLQLESNSHERYTAIDNKTSANTSNLDLLSFAEAKSLLSIKINIESILFYTLYVSAITLLFLFLFTLLIKLTSQSAKFNIHIDSISKGNIIYLFTRVLLITILFLVLFNTIISNSLL